MFYTHICFCDKNVERSKPKDLPVSQESPTESCHIIDKFVPSKQMEQLQEVFCDDIKSLHFLLWAFHIFLIFAEMGLKNQGHRDTVYT